MRRAVNDENYGEATAVARDKKGVTGAAPTPLPDSSPLIGSPPIHFFQLPELAIEYLRPKMVNSLKHFIHAKGHTYIRPNWMTRLKKKFPCCKAKAQAEEELTTQSVEGTIKFTEFNSRYEKYCANWNYETLVCGTDR